MKRSGGGLALLGEMVDETLLTPLAALHQSIEGRIVAEFWFGQVALGNLKVEVCEVTTI